MIDLIQGNSLHLPLADKSVDMVFTSPPFKEEDVDGDYWGFYDQCFNEMTRVCRKVLCIIHSSTKLNSLITNYPPKRLLIWGKGMTLYSYRYNLILVYQLDDKYKVNKYIWSDTFGVEAVTGKWKVHKYQDPELLYETIIKMFKGCNVILDPFCGSGTTARVCRRLGLNCVGIDLNIEMSRRRLGKQALADWGSRGAEAGGGLQGLPMLSKEEE